VAALRVNTDLKKMFLGHNDMSKEKEQYIKKTVRNDIEIDFEAIFLLS